MMSQIETKAKKAKKSTPWTREVLLTFFEVFEQHPCLYDTKNMFYSNKHARADALTKIIQDLGISVSTEDLKTKINNVRSQISHEIKKNREKPSGSGTEDVAESAWWFPHVQFLLPHMKSRKAKDSLDSANKEENQELQEDDMEGSDADIFSDVSLASSLPPRPRLKKRPMPSGINNVDLTFKKTLETLTVLNEKIVSDKNKQAVREAAFGAYVAEELSKIEDEELLYDAKHEISSILYKVGKKRMDQNATVIEIIES